MENDDGKVTFFNRATKRQLAKDLRRETVRAKMPDMTKEYRAKRRVKNRRARQTRAAQRRLAA